MRRKSRSSGDLADRVLKLAAAAAPPLVLAVLGLPVLFGLVFTVLPAFGWLPALGGSHLSLAAFRELLAAPGLWRSAWLSLATGLAASLFALGLVMGLLAGFAGTKAFSRLPLLAAPLLALPHAAAAFGLAFLLSPSGMLARLASPGLTGWTAPPDLLIVNDPLGLSLAAGLAAKEAPFLLLAALAALPQVRAQERRRLAASLGYGRVAGFLFTTWPPLYRQMRLAVFAVVVFSTSVVDVAAILGPTLPPVLSLRLLSWTNDPDLSRRFLASAGALAQLCVSATALLAWIGLERVFAALRDGMAEGGRRFARDRALRWAAAALAVLLIGGLAAGAASLLLWSLAGPWPFPDALPRTLSLDTWRRLGGRLAAPLGETMILGVASSLIALVLCVLCLLRADRSGRTEVTGATASRALPPPLTPPHKGEGGSVPDKGGETEGFAGAGRMCDSPPPCGKGSGVGERLGVGVSGRCISSSDWHARMMRGGILLIYLPLLVPQAAFLFGLQLLFLLAGLDAGRPALVLVHLVFVLPYAMLALSGPWAAFDRRFEQVAAGLGHGPAATLFRVRLPMLLPALLGSLAVGFAVSAGLYLPTVLIGAGRIATITTEAVALASGADRRVIGVFAFVQMLLPAAGFAVALVLPALLFQSRRGLRA